MKLLFLNGWSMPNELWGETLRRLDSFDSIEIQAMNLEFSLDDWTQWLAPRVDSQTVLAGWSLGGMLALHYASLADKPVAGVMSLMANPVFLSKGDWQSGMALEEYMGFRSFVEQAETGKWQRLFSYLVTQGMSSQRSAIKKLLAYYSASHVFEQEALITTLDLLATIDLRASLASISAPGICIFGQLDSLSPYSERIEELLPANIHTEVLPATGHCPVLDQPDMLIEQFKQQVESFCPSL